MKASETEIRFKTGFQQPKTGFAKKPVLTSLIYIAAFEYQHGKQSPIHKWTLTVPTVDE